MAAVEVVPEDQLGGPAQLSQSAQAVCSAAAVRGPLPPANVQPEYDVDARRLPKHAPKRRTCQLARPDPDAKRGG